MSAYAGDHLDIPSLSYSAKIINPARKSDYILRKFRVTTRFTSVEEIKQALSECFPDYFVDRDVSDIQVGYVSLGHGARGKQQWLSDDIDLDDMYEEYDGKKEITIWFYQSEDKNKKGKRSACSPTDTEPKRSRSTAHTEKIEEVRKIVKELKEKHTGAYTEKKLRMWAHLIEMGKHKSYSEPPDMPYFKKGTRQIARPSGPSTSDSSLTASVESHQAASTNVSPCKRVTLRTACIEQMDKWHSLLEKSVITKQQYDQLQDKIMSDMLDM